MSPESSAPYEDQWSELCLEVYREMVVRLGRAPRPGEIRMADIRNLVLASRSSHKPFSKLGEEERVAWVQELAGQLLRDLRPDLP